jgi:hypothetical protein
VQSVKDQFVAQFVSILKFGRRSPFELLGQLKGGGTFQSQTVLERLISWAVDKKHRRTVLLASWVLLVISFTCLSTLALICSHWIVRSYRPGILFTVVLWAVFFGVGVLFFLSSKTVITVFGGLLGISVDSITSGAGLLSKANDAVVSMAQQLETAFGINARMDDSFVRRSVWLFVIFLTVTCLPAFFSEKSSIRQG